MHRHHLGKIHVVCSPGGTCMERAEYLDFLGSRSSVGAMWVNAIESLAHSDLHQLTCWPLVCYVNR